MLPNDYEINMYTHKGNPVSYRYPEFTKIDLDDIKYALPNVCRYNGQLKWTLDRHEVLCVYLVDFWAQHWGDNQLKDLVAALVSMHDDHETYIGDFNTHLKKLLPGFSSIEEKFERVVHQFYGLPFPEGPLKALVKFIDLRALLIETRYFNHISCYEAICKRLNDAVTPGTPNLALEAELELAYLADRASPNQLWEILQETRRTYFEAQKSKENTKSYPVFNTEIKIESINFKTFGNLQCGV